MSKNVKSNNKNTKKSASKSKKSTRNIYKIESLEPRLMMDAEIPESVDFSKFNTIPAVRESCSAAICATK